MTTADTWAAASAAFYLGQVVTVGGLLWLAREEQAVASARTHAVSVRTGQPFAAAAINDRSWLILVVLAAACSSVGDLLVHLGAHSAHRAMAPVTDAPLLLVGPGLWYYTRAITRQASEPPPSWRRFVLHALPSLLAFVVLTWDVLSHPWAAIPASPERSVDEVVSLAPVAAQLMTYLVFVLYRIRRVKPQILQEMSDLTDRRLGWLSVAAWLLVCVVVVWMLSWLWPVAVSNLVTNLLMAGWLTTIGLFGVRQSNIFSTRPALAPAGDCTVPTGQSALGEVVPSANDSAAEEPVPDQMASSPQVTVSAKYTKASMAPEHMAMLAARLDDVMRRDKPFLESDLSLTSLAQAVGATPHELSQVLSAAIGQSFYDYVNAWRVDAVRTALARPGAAARPMLEIALECGFGSKSAFNEVFKRALGMTPSAYRKGLPATAAATGQVQTHWEGRQRD